MIIKAYKKKLDLDIPKNFTNLDQIEIEAMGRFVDELDVDDISNLNADAGVEAVRQIGDTELHQKPRGLIKRKLNISLQLLVNNSIRGTSLIRLIPSCYVVTPHMY